MTSISQNEYIRNLAIRKLKEFKEFRELVLANDISNGEIVRNANNMADILNALTDLQASRLIDLLISKPEPVRNRGYSEKRITQASNLLDEILQDIDGWEFE